MNKKGEVLVEHGSDVDARRFQSRFAAGISGDPEDTEKHPWDMFELSKHPDNLLRFVDDDIPGLTHSVGVLRDVVRDVLLARRRSLLSQRKLRAQRFGENLVRDSRKRRGKV